MKQLLNIIAGTELDHISSREALVHSARDPAEVSFQKFVTNNSFSDQKDSLPPLRTSIAVDPNLLIVPDSRRVCPLSR